MKVLRKSSRVAVLLVAAAVLMATSLMPLSARVAALPVHVQGKDAYASSGKTVSASLTSSTTTGNLIAVYVIWSNTGNVSLSDNRGNTYAAATAKTTWGSNYSSQMFYAKNISGGSTTVKATFANSVSFGLLYAHEYSGLDKASPLDVSKVSKGTSGTTLDSGAVTTTHASDLLFAGGASVGAVTAGGPGFTVRSTGGDNIIEDKTVSSTGSYNATATQSGNGWTMAIVALKAENVTDTTPPSVPTNLTATAVSGTQTSLNWTASTDAVGVTGYTVYRDGNSIATVTTPQYSDLGLTEGASYNYTVSARDAAGNVSAQSVAASVTMPVTPPDTESPTAPTGVHTTALTANQVSLGWNAASDNVGVTGYRVSRDGVLLTTTTQTTYNDTTVAAETGYTYTVVAIDAANNASADATLAVTTPAPTPGDFCSAIGTTPLGQPTAANTGVPAGTTLSTTPPAGVTVDADAWNVVVDGTVIDSKDIQGKTVIVKASNVTIKNSRILVPVETYYAVENPNDKPGLRIENSDIGSNGGALTGIDAAANTIVCGVNGHNFENIATVRGSNTTIQGNYFHGQQAQPSKGEPHYDVLEVRGGTNVKVLGNTLYQNLPNGTWLQDTGALNVTADWGDIDQFTIDGNWLGGGTYSLYLTKISGVGHPGILYSGTVTNNKFHRNTYAYAAYTVDDPVSSHITAWNNNTYIDNGETIPLAP
jgi:chitodextrinase